MTANPSGFFAGKRILVAGGAGMTGASIVGRLLELDPTVEVRATWHTRRPDVSAPRLQWVQANLASREACRDLVADVDAAILAASVTGGSRALNVFPEAQVTDNILVDAVVLEALTRAAVPRCIFFSTASLYQPLEGRIRESQLDRNVPPHPAHRGVGFVKRASEQLCQFWHERTGAGFGILRAANIYGPRAAFDPDRSNFIPALIRKAVDRRDPFEVWGGPDVVRDVLYVSDAADAAVRLLAADDLACETYNLGTGRPCTVADAVRVILAAAGHEPASVVYSPTAATTINTRVLDCRALEARLGWAPRVGLDEGVARTVAWWQDNRESWTR